MDTQEQFEVVVETDGQGIDVRIFNDFLYNFRAAYAAGVVNEHFFENSSDIKSHEAAALWIHNHVDGADWRVVSDLAKVDLGEKNLEIIDIRRENPLTIVFAGSMAALTIALILSGGKFQAGPFKVKLPPLGHGIASLRKALRRKP